MIYTCLMSVFCMGLCIVWWQGLCLFYWPLIPKNISFSVSYIYVSIASAKKLLSFNLLMDSIWHILSVEVIYNFKGHKIKNISGPSTFSVQHLELLKYIICLDPLTHRWSFSHCTGDKVQPFLQRFPGGWVEPWLFSSVVGNLCGWREQRYGVHMKREG